MTTDLYGSVLFIGHDGVEEIIRKRMASVFPGEATAFFYQVIKYDNDGVVLDADYIVYNFSAYRDAMLDRGYKMTHPVGQLN